MPELLLQSALAASKSKHLASQAAQIKTACHAQHGDSASLLSCPQCYESLLEAVRARFLTPAAATTSTSNDPTLTDQSEPQKQQQQQQQQQQEWFTPRRAFLSALSALIDAAKAYQVSPQAVDDRVREERSRWYAERVRSSLLRLMVEDPARRGAVFEKLEDSSAAAAAAATEIEGGEEEGGGGGGGDGDGGGGGGGGGDPVGLAREVAEILSKGPLAAAAEGGKGVEAGMLERLAAAGDDQAGKVGVLKEMFFEGDDGTVPEDQQKYLDMLLHQGLSMEQVVDRILEERQAALGAREQTDKLTQRLNELRRARTAHEAQKSRKAQRRESLAQQRVPDELYALPTCTVCGEAPNTEEFFCCSICTVLAGTGVQEKQTVFCSKKCEEKGYAWQAAHAETHICSSAWDCIQVQQKPQTGTSGDQDTRMDEAPPAPNDLCFCTECLTALKQPTMWCSPACADANFQSHRDEVHLPERKKQGLDVDDEAQLEYSGDSGDGNRKYHAKNIRALLTPLEEAVKEWEERNRVQLQSTV
ncbi:hypothetical protein NEMBOFW57_001605 [Staphylotrichum longicolle]|uniref:Uncharacterized protein n=1 Tax=Staphylotrichum longicolle TaxID=669026 RepID=A0AAD4I1U2_9PEZI|nr:hypothetical protein NEMBOFW57_001605 [Staphylotrichum longicolle]